MNIQNMQLYATGGLRYQHYSVDLSIDPVFFPGINRSGSQSWVDPIVGMALHYDINDRWFVDVMADVGGFGIASDITLQGTATVGYNWTDTISSSSVTGRSIPTTATAASGMTPRSMGYSLGCRSTSRAWQPSAPSPQAAFEPAAGPRGIGRTLVAT